MVPDIKLRTLAVRYDSVRTVEFELEKYHDRILQDIRGRPVGSSVLLLITTAGSSLRLGAVCSKRQGTSHLPRSVFPTGYDRSELADSRP